MAKNGLIPNLDKLFSNQDEAVEWEHLRKDVLPRKAE